MTDEVRRAEMEEVRGAVEAGEAVRTFTRTQGFAVVQAAISAALDIWTAKALQPSESEADVLRNEYAKGTLNGLRLALGMPEHIMTSGKEAMDSLASEENE